MENKAASFKANVPCIQNCAFYFWTMIWKMVLFKFWKILVIPLSWQDYKNKQTKNPQGVRTRCPHADDSTCLLSPNLILNCWVFVTVVNLSCVSSLSHFSAHLNLRSFCELNHSCGETVQGLAESLFPALTPNPCLLEQAS